MTLPSRESFLASVGSGFGAGAVPGLGGPSALVLRKLDDRRAPAGWECFSMLFEGPGSSPLLQGSFPFSHAALGSFDLFVVPVGEQAGLRTYEAIVYRPLPTAGGSR